MKMFMNMKWIFVIILALTQYNLLIGSENELTIYYYDRMPYYGDSNGNMEGILVEISKLILDEAKIKYVYKKIPSKRVLDILKEPGNTAALGWFRTKAREEIYNYTDEAIYQDEPYSLIVNKTNASLFQNSEIKNILTNKMRLGVVDGYVYGNWLDENLVKYSPETTKVNLGDDSERLYKMLLGNRFDYIFSGLEESLYIIKNNDIYKKNLTVVKISDAPAGSKRYILFSKGIDKTMLNKINLAFEKVKQSDQYKKILYNAKN